MLLGQVIGNVVSTIKDSTYVGEKILMVQPIDPDNQPSGDVVLAIDKVQAGVGDRVLVIREGNSVRQIMQCDIIPCNAVIVGIVDDIGFHGK